ncbi:MAG: type II toxin-antitoxin system HicB family antitoxin [Anaerolineae bacterium]|nr:type II toxin-antitoxin system HicB family antitoxin [Anaerolineae bacterium]
MRQVVIYEDEFGNWLAEVPSLPGCQSEGRTQHEAIRNIRKAIQRYIANLIEQGDTVPKERLSAVILLLEESNDLLLED